MYDGAFPSEPPAVARPPRSIGSLRVTFQPGPSLGETFQSGALHVRFPRPERGAMRTALMLNTSGGIAAGDRLQTRATWNAGAAATMAGATAERIYRAAPGDPAAHVRTHLTILAGATAEWLPQETILFDGARLDRALEIDLAPDARFLGIEALVFGRTARGETVRQGSLADSVTLRRDGRRVLVDRIRLDGNMAATLARPAVANAASAIASILYAAPDSATRLDELRAALPPDAGASSWDGILFARIVAQDGAALRRAIIAALAILRARLPLPRVWLC